MEAWHWRVSFVLDPSFLMMFHLYQIDQLCLTRYIIRVCKPENIDYSPLKSRNIWVSMYMITSYDEQWHHTRDNSLLILRVFLISLSFRSKSMFKFVLAEGLPMHIICQWSWDGWPQSDSQKMTQTFQNCLENNIFSCWATEDTSPLIITLIKDILIINYILY